MTASEDAPHPDGGAAPYLLVAGAGGFVGRAVLRVAPLSYPGPVIAVDRARVVAEIGQTRARYPGRPIALLLLSWPALDRARSSRGAAPTDAAAWNAFLSWVSRVAAAAAHHDISIWGVGSGIESVAVGPDPQVGEPYLTYGRRKAALYALLRDQPRLAIHWLRLHFLFGEGESSHRFVPAAIAACTSSTPLPLDAPGRRRHWLPVEAAARFLLEAIRVNCIGEWDITARESLSFAELCRIIETTVGLPLQTVPNGDRGADAGCLEVPAPRVPAFIPAGSGSAEDLAGPLREYVTLLGHPEPPSR